MTETGSTSFFVYVRIVLIYFGFTVVAKWHLNVFVIMEKMYGYESPVVEIIEVEVEKGFANSNEGFGQSGAGE